MTSSMRIRAYATAWAVLVALVVPLPAAASSDVYPMVFPVAGDNYYSDTWGAPRSGGRSHQGTDIIADKMTPVVAVADGYVYWMHDEQGGKCCALGIRHDDGWASWYIHLNNDTPGTDDGQGWGFAEGITMGARVTAGQLIGWVGDSGNAEASNISQLHFEIRRPNENGGTTPINPYPSLVAAEQASIPRLPRLAGATKFGTAAAVAQHGFPDGASTVFLATAADFADALAGAALAGSMGAPVLLTEPDRLPSEIATELQRLAPTDVVILGGTGAVTSAVEEAVVAATGAATRRLWGQDRFATAVEVSRDAYASGASTVVIVNGLNYPDALAGAPAAVKMGAPILMVYADRIPPATRDELQRLAPDDIVIFGGAGVVDEGVEAELATYAGSGTVTRVWGVTRYETATEIATRYFDSTIDRVYLATGENFTDALAAAPVAGSLGVPLLLTRPTGLPSAVETTLGSLSPQTVYVLGGEVALPVTIDVEVCAIIPACE